MRKLFPFYFLLLTFLGCATAVQVIPPAVVAPAGMKGNYHKVARKETLWRISQNYRVELDELIKINRISDASNIEVGQLIFIPAQPKPPAPAPASRSVAPASSYSSEDFNWPLRGRIIVSYGQTAQHMINKGINIAPLKSAEVLASRSGKVVFYSDNFLGFGKTLIIDHRDGFSTLYARNAAVSVKVGDEVLKGSPIAKVGAAGRDKNTYLHFEIRKGSVAQNPLFYLSN